MTKDFSAPTPLQLTLEVALANQHLPEVKQQIEQSLTQIILTSRDAQSALITMASLLGQSFLADYCLLGTEDYDQTITRSASWHSGLAQTDTHQEFLLLEVFKQPELKQQLADANLLNISDLKSIKRNLGTSKKKSNVGSDPRPISVKVDELRFRSILLIKIPFQQQSNRVIVLARSQPYQWKESEVQLLENVSNQVAIVISHAQLERQVHRQMLYQNLIDQLTSAIRNSWELGQIFQLAVEGIALTLQLSYGALLTFKYFNPLQKHHALESFPDAKVKVDYEFVLDSDLRSSVELRRGEILDQSSRNLSKPAFSLSDCALLQRILVKKTEPIAIATLHSPGEIAQSLDLNCIAPIFDPKAMPALLLMPIENQGTVMGCLVFQHHQSYIWQSEEIAFIKLVAAQLSTAIIQTRTLRQVQALVEERTAQLQRSLEVQAKLYEKTRKQVEQLQRLTQCQEEFLSTVSHELLTPLTSMTVAIRMLRQSNLSPERRTRYLDILEQQCAQESDLINDLLALQKLESGSAPMRLQAVDIRYAIRDLVQSFADRWAEKSLTLSLELPDRPVNLQTDLDSLNRILIELLTNAGKYAESGTTISLTVDQALDQKENPIVVRVRNIGSGITSEEMPRIFDKFSRGEGVTQRAVPGTGLGLALVRGLVEHLNGTITASSCPLNLPSSWETCFTVTLPQSPNSSLH
jgi:signal transduction histidine kinase